MARKLRFGLVGFLLALTCSYHAQAIADCAVRDALLQKHGVMYGGFKTPLPRTTEPERSGWNKHDVLHVSLNSNDIPEEIVSDRFFHRAVVNKSLGQAWIHRSGGVGGVSEWYGPISLDVASFQDCDKEKRTIIEKVTDNRKGDRFIFPS